MLPLVFLFGLGFDTASKVALLGISATQAGQGLSIWSIMVFSALLPPATSLETRHAMTPPDHHPLYRHGGSNA